MVPRFFNISHVRTRVSISIWKQDRKRNIRIIMIATSNRFCNWNGISGLVLKQILPKKEYYNVFFFKTPNYMGFFKDFIYLFLERREGRKQERDRNISVREKHWLVASLYMPQPGTEPAIQQCALTGNQACNLSFCGMMPNQQSHTSQGSNSLFKTAPPPNLYYTKTYCWMYWATSICIFPYSIPIPTQKLIF